MSSTEIEPISLAVAHLEFLGYKLTSFGDDNKLFRASHPIRSNFIIRSYRRGYLITITYRVQEDKKSDQLRVHKLINSLNSKFVVCRAYLDSDLDAVFEAFFPIPYDRIEFGIFIDSVESDVNKGLESVISEATELMK